MRKASERYLEKLRDPRWQKKRLEIMQRDGWKCGSCGREDKTLHVHHRYYTPGSDPWDYPDQAFLTLCEGCHQDETKWRGQAEAELLHALRKRFLVQDLINLAVGLDEARAGKLTGEQLSYALMYVLVHEDELRRAYDAWADGIARANAALSDRQAGDA